MTALRHPRRAVLVQLFGFLGGPLAWFAHVALSWLLVPLACETGTRAWLHLATVLALTVALTAAFMSWRGWRETGMERRTEIGGAEGRSSYFHVSGMLLGLFFGAAIAVGGSSNFVLDPCER